jgi:hypothetical protein
MNELIKELINFILWFSIGLVFSIFIGGKIIRVVLTKIKNKILEKAKENKEEVPEGYLNELYIPGKSLGYWERFIFTILVGIDISGIAAGMFSYITLKMLIDWLNLIAKNENYIKQTAVRSLIFRSLIGSLLSMLFAAIGGIICRQYNHYFFLFLK